MQDNWWDRKVDEVQQYADLNYSKEVFSFLKAVYAPQRPSFTPLLSADGKTLLKDMDSITQCWRKHFSTLLNRPFTVDSSALDAIPEKPALEELDLPPSLVEVTKAVKQRSTGKAPGMDGIPAKMYKAASPVALDTLHEILCSVWGKKSCHKTFKMPLLSPCIRTRAVSLAVVTTEASPFFQPLGKSLQELF